MDRGDTVLVDGSLFLEVMNEKEAALIRMSDTGQAAGVNTFFGAEPILLLFFFFLEVDTKVPTLAF